MTFCLFLMGRRGEQRVVHVEDNHASALIGFAANHSIKSGEAVLIDNLLEIKLGSAYLSNLS